MHYVRRRVEVPVYVFVNACTPFVNVTRPFCPTSIQVRAMIMSAAAQWQLPSTDRSSLGHYGETDSGCYPITIEHSELALQLLEGRGCGLI